MPLNRNDGYNYNKGKNIIMETRKVQQTGGSTYIISLPKQWAIKSGITTGTRISLKPQPDGTLLINPVDKTPMLTKKIINVSDSNKTELIRNIIAAYLIGYNVIEFKADQILSEQKKTIKELCYKLIGPEIIEESANNLLIQNMATSGDISLKKGLRRMFLITNSMHQDAIRALKEKDKDLALDVIQRDDEVDRLFLLIARQFRLVLRGVQLPNTVTSSIDEYHDYRMAAGPLERIADHAQKIANVVSTDEYEVPHDLIDSIESASNTSRKIVEMSVDALFNLDVDLANQAIDSLKDMRKQIYNLNESFLKLESNSTIIALRTVADSINRIGDYGTNIAEIAINLSMVDINKK